MVAEFYRAINCSTNGLAISVRLYLGPNEELYNSESDDDKSVSITSEDDSDNQTLFLFRFWVSPEGHQYLGGPSELEHSVNPECLAKIKTIMADYNIN